ncbi:hypothetical protein OROMI_012418 [Orobanche minor]
MEGKGNISDYRSKLDKTLALPGLKNYETVHTLVKNQLQSLDSRFQENYTDYVVERRSKEMLNLLGMLRSASTSDAESHRLKSREESQRGWKVKQDTDEFRVMYREGPKGTPFHTLLVEGYVDGPLDVCLCISCESDLYKKWWPQSSIPTFKVISSHCVKKIRIGEQISLVRMKVSWPLSSREALVHFFALEYFQDGLIVVLLNSISDLESIDISTHGFTRDGIPDADDVVRIDVVGGFVLQKATADRSYFRTIANMDIKLDFVPPTFINFISRQLVGSGFKLYNKEIASVSKGDGKFHEALKDPMYARIRESLYSQNTSLPSPALENRSSMSIALEENNQEAHECNNSAKEYNDRVFGSGAKNAFIDQKVLDEITELEEREQRTPKSRAGIIDEIIEEVETNETEVVTSNEVKQAIRTTNDITEYFRPELKNKVGTISPEVQRALGTLEKAISILRGHNNNSRKGQSDVKNGYMGDFKEENGEKVISSEADQIRRNSGACGESLTIGSIEASHELKYESDIHDSRAKKTLLGEHAETPYRPTLRSDFTGLKKRSNFRHRRSNLYAREAKQSKIPPDEGAIDSHSSSIKETTVSTVSDSMAENYMVVSDANSNERKRATKRQNKKPKFCCFVAQQEVQS